MQPIIRNKDELSDIFIKVQSGGRTGLLGLHARPRAGQDCKRGRAPVKIRQRLL